MHFLPCGGRRGFPCPPIDIPTPGADRWLQDGIVVAMESNQIRTNRHGRLTLIVVAVSPSTIVQCLTPARNYTPKEIRQQGNDSKILVS